MPYPSGGGTLFAPLREGVDLSYVIKPDYGSLEERLNKRTNLPEHLQGDDGREQHLHEDRNKIHGPCGSLEGDAGRMRAAVLGRLSGWVEENRGQKAHLSQGSGGGAMADTQVRPRCFTSHTPPTETQLAAIRARSIKASPLHCPAL